MQVLIADFTPDLPPNNSAQGSPNLVNLYPATNQSYAPMNSLSPYSSNALAGQCMGAITVPDASGNQYTFAGDAANLWEINPGNPAWQNVGTGYTLPTNEIWSFALFGARVIAVAEGQAIQSYVLGSSSLFSALSASAPKARYCTVVKDWFVVANTSDSVNGDQPQRIQWSAIDDPTTWPVSGSNQEAEVMAGSQIFPGDQGWIMGIVGNLGTSDGAIFFERAIWRMVYSGSPTIFSFYPCEGVRGTPAPRSIAHFGANVFYLGEDGFYVFDGSNSTPIGVGRVDKTFWNTVNQAYLSNVVGTIDPINKLAMWAYPSAASSNGVCDSLLLYNWAINKWGFAQISTEYIFRALSEGYSLEGLDSIVTPPNLDALPYSLDSRAWTGGAILIGAFDSNHKLNYFTGSALNTTADTVEVEPYAQTEIFTRMNLPSRRAFVSQAEPMIDGGSPAVSIGTRNRLIDSASWTAAGVQDETGRCPVRADGRYVRGRIQTTGNFTQLQGMNLYVRPSGGR
jgi:hypothetical protein